MNTRLKQAKIMLESKVFGLKEVAEKCGFVNEYYFSNAFKEKSAAPPKILIDVCHNYYQYNLEIKSVAFIKKDATNGVI